MPGRPDAVNVPNALLSDARWRMPSPNRPDAHMSRAELADAVNVALDHLYPGRRAAAHYVDHLWVGKLERGEHRWPSAERRAALRRVFNAATDDALGLGRAHRATQPPPERIDDTAGRPDTSGESIRDLPDAVDAWLHELEDLASMEEPQASITIRNRVHRRLDLLEELERGAAASPWATIDARWSEFMSWIADNNGDPDGAYWLSRSHRRASDAADHALIAYTLMRQSQRALDDGDVRAAIELSRSSLTQAPVPTRTRVLCLARMAEGLATAGDDDAFIAMSEARRELGGAGTEANDTFARHCDLRYVTAVDARCRQLMGDLVTAAEILEALLADDRATSPIDTGIWHARLGECHVPGAPEQAAQHGLRALQLARTSGSYRVVRATLPLAVGLRRHSGLPDVRSFLDAYRDAVTSRVTR
jgi:transcriptional regulator with XRE-family HTH domain